VTTHIMLDIETLGVRPGAVILSAAFVRFDDLASCVAVLDIHEQLALGMEVEPATHTWWGTQDPASWAAATQNPNPVRAVAEYFTTWLKWAAPADALIWCHGAGFDAPLLQELYRRLGIACPWEFWTVRDTRTLYDLAGVTVERTGRPHVALDDAIAQTHAAIAALKILSTARVTA